MERTTKRHPFLNQNNTALDPDPRGQVKAAKNIMETNR